MNKPHPHAALMADFANDAALTETPWENWEYFDPGGGWTPCQSIPAWNPHTRYRRKPRTIRAEEHLDLILTFCRSRLSMAEKRTPGAWERERYRVFPAGQEEPVCSLSVCDADGEFIAACAGAAEAGWRATIAAIEQYNRFCGLLDFDTMQPLADAILAAYPLELLQPTT